MKNFKYLSAMLLAIPVLTLLSTKAFANTEVAVTDNKDTHIATVSITHGNETLNAIDMKVVFSSNVSILNLDDGDFDCSMNKSVTENGNNIEILCLSENDLAKTGTIAEITYEVTDNEEYSFYVDQSSLDLGGITIDKITDINKPASVKDSVKQTIGDNDDNTIFTTAWSFVKEYYMYIIAGAFVLTLIIILLTSIKKDDTSTDTPTPTIVQ